MTPSVEYPEGFDLWAEENAPEVFYNATVYCVRYPFHIRRTLPTKVLPFVYLEVDPYGMVDVRSYHWFGATSSEGKDWRIQKEIFSYLQEWEYIQSIRIGPEDSEWFATDKLLSLPQENYWHEIRDRG
jgi:hypothetical protein